MARDMKEKKAPLISDDAKKIIEKDFSALKEPVTIIVFTDDRENKPFNEFSESFIRELASISAKIQPRFEKIGDDLSKQFHISRTPTLLIKPDTYQIRLTGAPAGEEARTLMIGILMASTGKTILSESSRKRLEDLREKRSIKVFVSPSCPYCPQQAAMAIAAAIEQKDLVDVEIIEIYENKDLATQFNAFSVPQVFINDQVVGTGLQPEEVFIEEIVTATPVAVRPPPVTAGKIEKDLVIIGAGPAGLTAAIYAERSGIRSVVIEKASIGGQVSITPVVENYPGFTKVAGKALMDMMAQQAIHYSEIHEGEEVLDIQTEAGLMEVRTNRTTYSAQAVLLTTGAESKKLDVPGEKTFQGRGVSYCAACDGFFFKDGKKVIVVGGGNTAATEALYLKNIGVDVTLLHRREKLRAELALQRSLAENGIPVVYNSVVREILGEKFVTGAKIENIADKSIATMPVDGIFVAIGYVPNNDLAGRIGIDIDAEGYIKVDSGQRTNVKRVYAAGDITGGVKQIVTAVGQGAVAAMTIFEDITNPYWKDRKQL